MFQNCQSQDYNLFIKLYQLNKEKIDTNVPTFHYKNNLITK